MKDENMTPRPEKETAGEIQVNSKFARWFENFWYHYKFQTLALLFFIVVFAVCAAQCATRETTDLTVTFAGPYDLAGEEKQAFAAVLSALSPTDEKKGTPLSVTVNAYLVYDEETLRSRYFDEDGNFDQMGFQSAKGYNTDRIKNFGTFVMTGESPLLFASPYINEYQNLSRLAVPLSQLYPEGNVTGAMANGYAVRLGDTAFYRYYKAVQVLPADTMIILCQPYVWGASADNDHYEDYEALFRAIVEFQG